MKWTNVKKLLRQIWLVAARNSLQECALEGSLQHRYCRQWEEYPWTVTEAVHFKCLSALTGLYQVEKTLTKQYLLDGRLKTEVAESKVWTAAYHSCCHLLIEIGGDRQISFVPESMQICLGIHVFTLKRTII
jgi:hypothetical protein